MHVGRKHVDVDGEMTPLKGKGEPSSVCAKTLTQSAA